MDLNNLPVWVPFAAFIIGVPVAMNVIQMFVRRSHVQKFGGPIKKQESTLTSDERTARLLGPWGFDQQDLDSNRKLQLSPRQQEQVEKGRKQMAQYTASNPRVMLIVCMVIFFVVGGIMFFLLRQTGASIPVSPIAIIVIGAVVVLVPIVVVLSARRTSTQVADAAKATIDVLSVDGPAKYVAGGSSRSGGTWIGVEISGVRFTAGSGVFADGSANAKQWAFVEGESYRIFYSKVPVYGSVTSNQFWSAEAI